MKNREIAEWLRQQANALHMPSLMLEDGIEDKWITVDSLKDASDAIKEMQKTLEDKAKELEADVDVAEKNIDKEEAAKAVKCLRLAFTWNVTPFPDLSGQVDPGYKWRTLCDFLESLTKTNHYSRKVADYLSGAFIWDNVPFPSLNGLSTDYEKWYAVERYLVRLIGEENE